MERRVPHVWLNTPFHYVWPEEYFCVSPLFKRSFLLSEEDGIRVRIDWDYCQSEEKILRTYDWCQTVREYHPVVTM